MEPLLHRSPEIENRLVGMAEPNIFVFQRHGYGVREVWIDAERGVLVKTIDLEPGMRAESATRSYSDFQFYPDHRVWLPMRIEKSFDGVVVLHEVLEQRINEGIAESTLNRP